MTAEVTVLEGDPRSVFQNLAQAVEVVVIHDLPSHHAYRLRCFTQRLWRALADTYRAGGVRASAVSGGAQVLRVDRGRGQVDRARGGRTVCGGFLCLAGHRHTERKAHGRHGWPGAEHLTEHQRFAERGKS